MVSQATKTRRIAFRLVYPPTASRTRRKAHFRTARSTGTTPTGLHVHEIVFERNGLGLACHGTNRFMKRSEPVRLERNQGG
jgi:hypothetical protein